MEKKFLDGLLSAPLILAQRLDSDDNVPQAYRSMFMRDRDRILYSKAFRRLSGKTQIYCSGIDDHRRTRLTHTLEVSQIASTISEALGLNRDLTEAIALGHDIGHTPFGHAGEQVLHEIMTPADEELMLIRSSPITRALSISDKDKYFGFKHNLQSVRTATTLENIYGDYGLDLTNYTLWGIQNHSNTVYNPNKFSFNVFESKYYDRYLKMYKQRGNDNIAWSFEAFVVQKADDIAQWHHDLEDAIRGNAMTKENVLSIMRDNLDDIMNKDDIIAFEQMKELEDDSFIIKLSRIVVNTLVNRIVECSRKNMETMVESESLSQDCINDFFIHNTIDNKNIEHIISYDLLGENQIHSTTIKDRFSTEIAEKVHQSYDVQRMNIKGQYIIRKLFQAYFRHPQQLPTHSMIQYLIGKKYDSKVDAQNEYKSRGEGAIRDLFDGFIKSETFKESESYQIDLMRTICDHIACMTDSYAIKEFQNLYN